jgi:hypothetical protein
VKRVRGRVREKKPKGEEEDGEGDGEMKAERERWRKGKLGEGGSRWAPVLASVILCERCFGVTRVH